MNKKYITLGSILFVCMIVLFAGVTYAYYSFTAVSNNSISGNQYDFRVSMTMNTIKKATTMIPVENDKIVNMMTSNCVDNGYEVCSLYSLAITNLSATQNLHPYIKTISSSYTTSNLKARLYTYANSTYTAVSDILTLSNTTNASSSFTSSSSSLSLSISANATNTYYLVIWLTETGTTQNDQNKNFKGTIFFESAGGTTNLQSTFG